MNRTPEWYLDEAKNRSGIKSDRALSEFIGQSANWSAQVRTNRSLPSDEAMIRLAQIAGVDTYVGLLDLSAWRTQGEARKAYEEILKKITVAIAIFITIGAIAAPARAAPAPSQNCQMENAIVYIMENIEQGACGFGKKPAIPPLLYGFTPPWLFYPKQPELFWRRVRMRPDSGP